MKILSLLFILTVFYFPCASKALDADNLVESTSSLSKQKTQSQDQLIHFIESQKQANEQQSKIIEKLTKENELNRQNHKTMLQDIENMKKLIAMRNNPDEGYRKVIPANLGVWLAIGYAAFEGIYKYDKSPFYVIYAIPVMIFAFFNFYWVFKVVRDLGIEKTIPKK